MVRDPDRQRLRPPSRTAAVALSQRSTQARPSAREPPPRRDGAAGNRNARRPRRLLRRSPRAESTRKVGELMRAARRRPPAARSGRRRARRGRARSTAARRVPHAAGRRRRLPSPSRLARRRRQRATGARSRAPAARRSARPLPRAGAHSASSRRARARPRQRRLGGAAAHRAPGRASTGATRVSRAPGSFSPGSGSGGRGGPSGDATRFPNVPLLAACDDAALLGFDLWPRQRRAVGGGGGRAAGARCGRSVVVPGKSTMAALLALHSCLFRPDFDAMVRDGELRYAVAVATNLQQAQLIVRAAESIVERSPLLAPLVRRPTADGIEFLLPCGGAGRRCARFRATVAAGVGWPISCLMLDEAAHFLSDTEGDATAERVWSCAGAEHGAVRSGGADRRQLDAVGHRGPVRRSCSSRRRPASWRTLWRGGRRRRR